MKAKSVAKAFEEIAPRELGIPKDELGFLYGDPETTVSGVGCAWCLHTASLRHCIRQSLNMIICHERLWMPAQSSPWYDGPSEEEILPNRLRRELLEEHNFVVYRSHSNWDALPEHGVADSAVAALDVGETREIARRKFFSVHELTDSLTVAELRERVGRSLGFEVCRLFGDAKRRVRRFAFLIGGFGENQMHMPQAAAELGAEAILIGEMSEFVVIACLEMGLPVIETLHSVSEAPGIRAQAKLLAERLAPLWVEYVPSGAVSFTELPPPT